MHREKTITLQLQAYVAQSELDLWYLSESMTTKASALREDWATAEQIERMQLQLLDVVDFINQFHESTRTRLAILNEKMTSVERKLRYVESAVRKARSSSVADPIK